MGCNANSASAALNKWLKKRIGSYATVHGFRHSFRDRLRDIEAPREMIDQVGGWSSTTVGQRYGNGYSLSVVKSWMGRLQA